MSDRCGKYTRSGSNTRSCSEFPTWNSVECLWLCDAEALSLYAGSTDEAPEITAEERAEFGETRELDAPVQGSIVDVAPADISATLESHSELPWLWLSCPRDPLVSAIECSCEAAWDEGLLSADCVRAWLGSIASGSFRRGSNRELRCKDALRPSSQCDSLRKFGTGLVSTSNCLIS